MKNHVAPAASPVAAACHLKIVPNLADSPSAMIKVNGHKLIRSAAFLLVVLIVASAVYLRTPAPTQPGLTRRSQAQLMGTLWNIAYDLNIDKGCTGDLSSRVFSEIDRIEMIMSEWRSDSPISAINHAAGNTSVTVPQELSDLIQRAIHIGDNTRGAFDISWRGLSGLWQFRQPFTLPSEDDIAAALALVDYRRIEVSASTVYLPQQRSSLGLGGIAKGYAIDRAVDVLKQAGCSRILVEGGGDIRVNTGDGDKAWVAGIRDPAGTSSEFLYRLALTRGAIVTSGDYERFVMHKGIRYHHILDPRTGRPARNTRQVTVVAPLAETADALATALFVLGAEDGMEVVRSFPQSQALWVLPGGVTASTPGFHRLIKSD